MRLIMLFRAMFGGIGTAAGDVFPTIGFVFGALGILFGVSMGGPIAIALAVAGFATFFAIAGIQGYLAYRSDRLKENDFSKLDKFEEVLNSLDYDIDQIDTLLNIKIPSGEKLRDKENIVQYIVRLKTEKLKLFDDNNLSREEKIRPMVMGFFGAFSVIAGGSAGTLGSLAIALGVLTAVMTSPIGIGIVAGILAAATVGGMLMAYANYRYTLQAHDLKVEAKAIEKISNSIKKRENFIAGAESNASKTSSGSSDSKVDSNEKADKAFFDRLNEKRQAKQIKSNKDKSSELTISI